jgi:hypothetical protein
MNPMFRSKSFKVEKPDMFNENRRRVRIALLWALIPFLSGCDSHGGMEFSVYGVQVIANDSDTIPAGQQLELGFEAYRSGRYIFKVDSSSQRTLTIRLLSDDQLQAGRRSGKYDHLQIGSGPSVQFERNLSEGKYHLLIRNASSSSDNASYNITAAEN